MKGKYRRKNLRKPLHAEIIMSDDESVIVGECCDISVEGLKILTDHLPAKVGAQLKMKISPSSQDPDNPMDPFVAIGVVVSILEDGRGFSCRFEQLSGKAKLAIESYIYTQS